MISVQKTRVFIRFRKGPMLTVRCLVAIAMLWLWVSGDSAHAKERVTSAPANWKVYTNARFGFTVRYPSDWRLGEPLPDGVGVTIMPPEPQSQIAFTGFLNLVEGTSPDGRQTLDEFASAHRRILGEYYGQKNIALKWQEDRTVTLGSFPAKQLSFSYQDESKTEMIELHILSLGRNEGRGVRIKFPASSRSALMPLLADVLQTYQPGRDQNAVSPFQPIPQTDPKEKAK